MDRGYINRLRNRYPEIDGRADYCVYWFRRAHQQLTAGRRAGLVGTNTVRQNYSREGGLDYIVANGGTLTEAVFSMIWPGEAVVHVSIVNWIKGEQKGKKRLYNQDGNDRRLAGATRTSTPSVRRFPSNLTFQAPNALKRTPPVEGASRVRLTATRDF
jgi:hypothetical protein